MSGPNEARPRRTIPEEVAAGLAAADRLVSATGGDRTLLGKQVLVLSCSAPAVTSAALACLGATVTVVPAPIWEPERHPRLLRALLLALHAEGRDVNPYPVRQLLQNGRLEAAAIVPRPSLEGLGEPLFDRVLSEPSGQEAGVQELPVGLASLLSPGALVMHDCPEGEAGGRRVVETALEAAGFEVRSDEPSGEPGRRRLVLRKRTPVGTEYPADGQAPQTLAHSAARYAFAAQFVRGRRVLDVGCGAGLGTRRLLDAGAAEVQGIDRREEALALARRDDSRQDPTAYRQGDLNDDLPYPDGRFDAVVCLEVLEHVDRQGHLAAEIHRVLAEGGIAVISVPHDPFEDFWSRVHGEDNPYHADVPGVAEMKELLVRFTGVCFYGQTDLVASVVLPIGEDGSPVPASAYVPAARPLSEGDTITLVAVCRKGGDIGTLAPPVAHTYGGHQGEVARLTRQVLALRDAHDAAQYQAFREATVRRWLAAMATRGRGESWGGFAWAGLRWVMREVGRAGERLRLLRAAR